MSRPSRGSLSDRAEETQDTRHSRVERSCRRRVVAAAKKMPDNSLQNWLGDFSFLHRPSVPDTLSLCVDSRAVIALHLIQQVRLTQCTTCWWMAFLCSNYLDFGAAIWLRAAGLCSSIRCDWQTRLGRGVWLFTRLTRPCFWSCAPTEILKIPARCLASVKARLVVGLPRASWMP